jgi:hypothetical protein
MRENFNIPTQTRFVGNCLEASMVSHSPQQQPTILCHSPNCNSLLILYSRCAVDFKNYETDQLETSAEERTYIKNMEKTGLPHNTWLLLLVALRFWSWNFLSIFRMRSKKKNKMNDDDLCVRCVKYG